MILPALPPDLPGLRCVRAERSEDGERIEVYEFDGGALHRKTSGSSCLDEVYDSRGLLHRTEGPATFYYLDGTLTQIGHFADDEIHRVGGPATTTYSFEDGSMTEQRWVRRGMTSRLDGPAVVEFRDDAPWRETWWVYGLRAGDGGSGAATLLRALPPDDLNAEIEHSVFAPLLAEGISVATIVGGIDVGVRTVEGMRGLAEGAPAEWVRSFESGAVAAGSSSVFG